MSPIDVPGRWRAILSDIQEHAPEAFIGGGALRDLSHGCPVKDIDVFLPEHRATAALARTIGHLGYVADLVTPMAYLGSDPTVYESREYYHTEGGVSLNIILLSSGYHFPMSLDRFDFGLCQIGFDGKFVVTTPAYDQDASERTLTVCRADDIQQLDRSKRRYDRLSKKYPGYPLIIPSEFNHTA